MTTTQQPEALNLEEFRAKVTRAAREPLLARIAELEAQLSAIGAGGVEPLRKPASPIAWPKDAQDVRDFFRSDFITAQPAAEDMTPCDEDRYLISAHDFLSAVNWWADSPHIPRTPGAAPSAAPVVPQGWKPVQIELLERIQESIGSFISDQGWSQSDMDTADALDGLLAAATQPAAQGVEADLTDEQIDEAFNQMPDGAYGFLKSWGYRQFARAVLAAQAKQGGAA